MTTATGFPVPLRGAAAPTLMWAHEYAIEPAAVHQLRRIADLPWVDGVRVMPDVHLGKGATVGSVIAMRQAVSPSAVGVDIGCGMSAARTNLTLTDLPDDLSPMRRGIETAVPVGFAAHDGRALRHGRVESARRRDHRRREPARGHQRGKERLGGMTVPAPINTVLQGDS